jgi:hypothetical protein
MFVQDQNRIISTEQLSDFLCNLESKKFVDGINQKFSLQIKDSRDLAEKIKESLKELVNSDEYESWLDNDNELNGIPCPLPSDQKSRDFLQCIGIASPEAMLVKINSHKDCYLLTDGLWVDQSIRAFPFTDESDAILSYIEKNNLSDWPDVIIDPCTGSGNHIVGFKGNPVRLGFDISIRSILYASINSLINNISPCIISRANLTSGIPSLLEQVDLGKCLFIINTPFALAPVDTIMVKTANGGEDGLELTLAAMDLVKKVFESSSSLKQGRAIVLCYSIGNGLDKWYAVDKARVLFGDSNVSWEILSDRKIWRINGQKNEPNPMLLIDSLPKKADCQFYIANKNRDEVRKKYIDLANRLQQNAIDEKLGYDVTHLGYGVIDICWNK